MAAQIFISYASEDRLVAAALAADLINQGWTVWWDRELEPGSMFARTIEQVLDSARCVIVLWSEHSVTSHWVCTEAGEGLERNILVPAMISDCKIPLEFRRIQAAVIGESWSVGDHEVQKLMKAVRAKLGVDSHRVTASRRPSSGTSSVSSSASRARRMSIRLAPAVAIAIILLGLVAAFAIRPLLEDDGRENADAVSAESGEIVPQAEASSSLSSLPETQSVGDSAVVGVDDVTADSVYGETEQFNPIQSQTPQGSSSTTSNPPSQSGSNKSPSPPTLKEPETASSQSLTAAPDTASETPSQPASSRAPSIRIVGPLTVQCWGDNHTYTVENSGGAITDWNWNTGNLGLQSGWNKGPNAVLSFDLEPGSYPVKVSVNGGAATATLVIDVTEGPGCSPDAAVQGLQISGPREAACGAKVAYQLLTTAGTVTSADWSSTSIILASTSTSGAQMTFPTQAGSYSVKVTVDGGASTTRTITVTC